MRHEKIGAIALLLSGALLIPLATRAHAPGSPAPLRVLIVGGGPSLDYNQVAIESNVRYVGKLLPSDTIRATLFANGDANSPTVLYEEDANALSIGERLFTAAFEDPNAPEANPLHYKKPNLGAKLDGPSNPEGFERVFGHIVTDSAQAPVSPLLLYFTGHGSPGDKKFENNVYDMWGDKTLSVRQLAKDLARLPDNVPVTVVMVQCHSGAFGNLLFEGGRPDGKPIERDIAGFFAATADRVAAGCTSEVDEAEYRDFTSYFFAALTGRDRVGRRVKGADYNRDGRVGMNEAYCYTLANDRSIDVPVCTSDIFLRRFVVSDDAEVFKTRYSDVQKWASPAQRYALDTLAKSLHRGNGEKRLEVAYNQFFGSDGMPAINDRANRRELRRNLTEMQKEAKRTLLGRWPDLRDRALPDYALARKQAVAYLTEKADEPKWKAFAEAENNLAKTEADDETRDIAESHLLRFIMLGKSIILAHQLRQTGDPAIKARFERLLEAEGKTILPPADSLAATHAAH